MYFKLKSCVLFRDYGSYGYLTDNRNFGYKLLNNIENHLGDKVVSESGALFLSVLSKIAQPYELLINKINSKLLQVDISEIRHDVLNFYSLLEEDGFLVSGSSYEECMDRDIRFSYKYRESRSLNKLTLPEKKNIVSTQEFLEKELDGKPQLTNIHVEVTSICNERCIHCYIPHENKNKHIEADLFYDILDQCRKMKILHITISGGEPMLHSNFIDFLRKCRENDFSVNVLSNLTILSNEVILEMKKNPLLGVQTSLYSLDPVVHDNITQIKGSCEKTKDSILKLIENDIPLQISCPILKQNKNCYKDVVDWAKSKGVYAGDDYVIIARYNHTVQNLDCRLSISEVRTVINTKMKTDLDFVENIKLEANRNNSRSLNDNICSVCSSSLCIAENGNAYPCAGWQDFIVGNIKQTSLYDIWENSEKVKYLRNLKRKDFKQCIDCLDKEYCTLCMVRNANESSTGNPLEINNYFCDIVRLNKTLMNKHCEG